MEVLQNFISIFFGKLFSLLGFPDGKPRLFNDIYWQYALYGVASFSKNTLKGLEALKKGIRRRNKKFASWRYRCINIGDFTDMSRAEVYKGGHDTKLTVGKYCSVSWDVSFLLGAEHVTEFNTTYRFSKFLAADKYVKTERTKGDIVIGNDVWIASGVKILSGVNIGDGAVIGANSLVTKDVPKYAVYGGNPAKLIRMRFSEDIIKIFEEIKWWDWPLEDIDKAAAVLQSPDITALKAYYVENIVRQKNGI
jgi:acetyltransferase-like isoleucine patch superfamily enzyme